ncbi:hypothetical protein FIM12_04615 [SAR202 cluster bacterium AD-804-J14_MRT_500m]|nr:hypothetical protein [SAR202 cluster bacterium AD-804-J14_MRT_500m]
MPSVELINDLTSAPAEYIILKGHLRLTVTNSIAEQGRITSNPTWGQAILKAPRDLLARFAVTAGIGVGLLALYLIADNAYPHGPSVFTGETEVVCIEERRCREVPIYKEVTSGLNNPGWVGVVRTMGLLIIVPAVILLGSAIYYGIQVEKYVPAYMKMGPNMWRTISNIRRPGGLDDRLFVPYPTDGPHLVDRIEKRSSREITRRKNAMKSVFSDVKLKTPYDRSAWAAYHFHLALLGEYTAAIEVVDFWIKNWTDREAQRVGMVWKTEYERLLSGETDGPGVGESTLHTFSENGPNWTLEELRHLRTPDPEHCNSCGRRLPDDHFLCFECKELSCMNCRSSTGACLSCNPYRSPRIPGIVSKYEWFDWGSNFRGDP